MRASAFTDQNKRKSNQDNKLIIPKIIHGNKTIFALVADGMGGTEHGEIASQIAKEEMEAWYAENIERVIAKPEKIKESLLNVIQEINQKVICYGMEHRVSLGTTMTMLLIYKKNFYVANIGDSRVYQLGKTPRQITQDHTAAQQEVNMGRMTEEEAKTSTLSHKLTRCIGMEEFVNPDFFYGKTKKGDYFLLCSDGMYNRVDLEEINKIAKSTVLSTKEKLTELTILSKSKDEKDNITGIFIEV